MSRVEPSPSEDGRMDAMVLAVLADSVVYGAVRGQRPLPGTWREVPLARHDAAGRHDALRQALAEVPSQMAGRVHGGLRVCVSDAWLDALTLPWRDALRRKSTALGYARASLGEAGCELDVDDVVVVDDAPYQSPRLAVRYPAPLMAALRDTAGQLGVALTSVRALSMVAATAAAPRASALEPSVMCVAEDGAVSLAWCQGHVRELVVRRLAALPDRTVEGGASQVAGQLMARQRLRQPSWQVPTQGRVLNLCADQAQEAAWPQTWQPWQGDEGEHEAPGVPVGPLRLVAGLLSKAACWQPVALDAIDHVPTRRYRLGAMAIAVLWALPCWWLWQGASATWQAQAPSLAEAGAPVAVQPADPEQLKRVKALNEAIDVLNTPVSAILQALQPPKDIDVGILSLDFATEPTLRKVRIAAESPSSADMLRYVDFVSARAPFESGRLIHHERVDAATGQGGLRYTMEVTWRH